MLTDWMIVRRLAAELDRTLRGARVREAGRLADGRFGLRVAAGTVALDAFGPTPIVALEGEHALERESGWVRTMADALEGLRIDGVRARRGDRLIAIALSSRSRFGVESGYRLVAELVPRFGNVVLLKDDTVVSAAKEFARGEHARRATLAGESYEPPPLPGAPSSPLTLAQAYAAMTAADTAEARAAASVALRAREPLVPRLVAESLVAESARALGASPDALAERSLTRARNILDSASGTPEGIGDVFAYRDGGRLVQCHTVPLAQFGELALSRPSAIAPLLAENVGGATAARGAQAFAAKRAALGKRIEKRRVVVASEVARLERERDDADGRDALRRAGDALYAHLGEVPARATSFVPASDPTLRIALDPELDAKGNAAAIFKRYRKATAKLEHVASRLGELGGDARFAEQLAWELERAEPETLDEVLDGIARLERRKSPVAKERAKKRKPLDLPLGDDARIYVGRSPVGNADLTFRIARPDDLWFHAQKTPGAHVVLRIDSARSATPAELAAAAALAAYHSKARESEKVAVDYTERKFVRRQQNAPPGLVWYTGAKTLLVAPGDGAALLAPERTR
ncbi:MAG: hypothetical protein NVSMB21_11600 [Vulcanimicrobiaceae bacterium]